jgi:hypothetical protein
MRNILAILEPRTFPIAISVLPEIAARSDTISSGILVPIATIVSQIIASDIHHFLATDTAPSTRRLPPTVRSARPRMIAPREIRISILDCLKKIILMIIYKTSEIQEKNPLQTKNIKNYASILYSVYFLSL